MYTCHNSLIQLSIKWHSSCVHILALRNSAAVSTGVHISLQISVFKSWAKYPEGELLGHMVTLFLIWGEPPYCFPQWLYQFTFSPAVCVDSLFSTSSPTLTSCFIDNSHWYFIVVLIGISVTATEVEHLFTSVGHLYVFLRSVSVQVLHQFLS